MTSQRLILAAAALVAGLAAPTAASAEDYCVGAVTGCTGTAVGLGDVKPALADAALNGSDDRFFLPEGVVAALSLSHVSPEKVEIVGAGVGVTKVRSFFPGPTITLGGNPQSSVHDVTLEPEGIATSALRLVGTRASRIAFTHGVNPS